MFINNKSISQLSAENNLLTSDLFLISRKNGSTYESKKVQYSVLSSQRMQDIANSENKLTSAINSISNSIIHTIDSVSTFISSDVKHISSNVNILSLGLSAVGLSALDLYGRTNQLSSNVKQLSSSVNIMRENITTLQSWMLTAGAYVFPDYEDPFQYEIYSNNGLKNRNYENLQPYTISSEGYIQISQTVVSGQFSVCVDGNEVTRMDQGNDNAVFWIPVKVDDIVSVSAMNAAKLSDVNNYVRFYHTWKPYITIQLLFDTNDGEYSGYLDTYSTTIISAKNELFVFPDDNNNPDGTESLYYLENYDLTSYSCSDGHEYYPGDSLVCISNLTAIGHYKKSFKHYVEFWNEGTLISSYLVNQDGIYTDYDTVNQQEYESIEYPDLRRTEYAISWYQISGDDNTKIDIEDLPTQSTISSDWKISSDWTQIELSNITVDDTVVVEVPPDGVIDIDDLPDSEKPLFIQLNTEDSENAIDQIFILAANDSTNEIGILNIK